MNSNHVPNLANQQITPQYPELTLPVYHPTATFSNQQSLLTSFNENIHQIHSPQIGLNRCSIPFQKRELTGCSAPPLSSCPPTEDGSNLLSTGTIPKDKRFRTSYTTAQLVQMEREFQASSYLYPTRRTEMAQRLALSEDQIKVWFQNRRMKTKKELKQGQGQGQHTIKNLKASNGLSNEHKEMVKRLFQYSQYSKSARYNTTKYDTLLTSANVMQIPADQNKLYPPPTMFNSVNDTQQTRNGQILNWETDIPELDLEYKPQFNIKENITLDDCQAQEPLSYGSMSFDDMQKILNL